MGKIQCQCAYKNKLTLIFALRGESALCFNGLFVGLYIMRCGFACVCVCLRMAKNDRARNRRFEPIAASSPLTSQQQLLYAVVCSRGRPEMQATRLMQWPQLQLQWHSQWPKMSHSNCRRTQPMAHRSRLCQVSLPATRFNDPESACAANKQLQLQRHWLRLQLQLQLHLTLLTNMPLNAI